MFNFARNFWEIGKNGLGTLNRIQVTFFIIWKNLILHFYGFKSYIINPQRYNQKETVT